MKVSEAECYKNIKVSIKKKALITDLDPNCYLWRSLKRQHDFQIFTDWKDLVERCPAVEDGKKTLGMSFSKFALLVKFTRLVVEVKFTLLSRKKAREYSSARKMCLFYKTLSHVNLFMAFCMRCRDTCTKPFKFKAFWDVGEKLMFWHEIALSWALIFLSKN